jgi:hypothetical protein
VLVALVTHALAQKQVGRVPEKQDLLAQIGRARAMLKDESVRLVKGTVGTRRVRVGRRKYTNVPIVGILSREIAIAVGDRQGNIVIGRALKTPDGLEVLTPGLQLSVRRENGINSDIACIDPPGGRVLALKYPVDNGGRKFGPEEEVLEVVYSPYSPEIATDEVVDKGIDVQSDLIDKAYSILKRRQVFSRTFPGRPVADVIPKETVTVLLMNEHIDPGLFYSAGHAETLVRQVLTIIGTNRERAYAYSISSAGARGLVQMIPSTYSLIVRKYPEAQLIPEFRVGMSDATNAVIAQVLLCDADWEKIRTREDIPADRIGPYLAAAYNGGVGRVLSVLDHGHQDWMEAPDASSQPTKTVERKVPVRVRSRGRVRVTYVVKRYTQSIFRAETKKYVRQYHWINDFFIDRNVKGFRRLSERSKEN